MTALAAPSAHALDPFVDASDRLGNPELKSGVAIGVTDMNGDGLDDLVRLDDASVLEIEYQQPDGSFERYVFGDLPGSQWGLALGDIDGNGYVDVYTGGAYNGHKILRANDAGDDFELTVLNQPDVFTQCVNFADIDNNGTLDLFICNDDGISAPMNNDGTGAFTYDLGLINPASTIPSDDSGNYGTVWTDYDSDGDLDLYIAKCRLFVDDPLDGRRVNLLFQNDGNGNYTDVAEAAGLRPLAQSWAMDFGDIDNDGDMDAFLVNHDMVSQLYLNQGPGAGQGTFVDITDAAGMTADLLAIDLGIQAHFEDFDNDTFLDLLVTGREGEHRLFLNNGDLTFTAQIDPFPTDGLGIQSAVVGDLDADGFQDVLAGFASGFNNPSSINSDRLLLNPGNDNNWLDVRLTGVISNRSAAGARIELHGAWGVMVREVRAGEGYGITNSFIRHFGLGAATSIDSVVVRWPSGQVDTAENPDVLNQTVHIVEGCPDTWYADTDGDGYGDPQSAMNACLPPQGHVADATDCDDTDEDSFPGNPEVCDGHDNDCNGQIDDGLDDCTPDPTGGMDSTGTPGSGDATAGPGSAGPGDGGESTGDDAGAADGGDGGCGCRAQGSRSGAGYGLLALGLLLGARRRRRLAGRPGLAP
ncbi:MAG: VCBS repeat-containing protein [Myxococcales bacterium]|nr:VCBS repeat-containing protein [Myxococcales bacterium]